MYSADDLKKVMDEYKLSLQEEFKAQVAIHVAEALKAASIGNTSIPSH